MAWTASRVSLQKRRGTWEVSTIGRTARGVKYHISTQEIDAATIDDPQFKGELAAAVTKLNVSAAPNPQFPVDIGN